METSNVIVIDSGEHEYETRTKSGTSYFIDESGNDNNFCSEEEKFGGITNAEEQKGVADVSDPQLAEIYAYDAMLKAKCRRKHEKRKSTKKKDLELTATTLSKPDEVSNNTDPTHVNLVVLPDTSDCDSDIDSEFNFWKTNVTDSTNSTQLREEQIGECSEKVEKDENWERNNNNFRSNGGINGHNYVYRTKEEEHKMIKNLFKCSQLPAIFAFEARIKRKSSKKTEKERLKRQKTDGKSKIAGVMCEMQVALPKKKPEEVPGNKERTYVNLAVLPGTTSEINSRTDLTSNINSSQLSKEQRGECDEKAKENGKEGINNSARFDCGISRDNYMYRTKAEEYEMIANFSKRSQVSAVFASDARNSGQLSEEQSEECDEKVKEDEKEGTNNKSVRFDGGISRGNYMYRTKAEEYEMITNFSKRPQVSAVFASNSRIKSKSMKKNEKRRLKRQRLTNVTAVGGTEKNVEAPDIEAIAVSANDMPQQYFVTCPGQDNDGNILKAVKTTEEAKVCNGLRSSVVINDCLSVLERSKGYEETAGLGNVRGLTEAIERETRKIFDRRDCSDVVTEIVKHGNSTTDAETNMSMKLEALKGEDNLVLRKLLRSPRYFDLAISSGEMCNICGKDDHKEAECNMQRRKKPCYRCGDLQHNARNCMQFYECFKCHGLGHLARNCLEKPSGDEILDVCLRCGNSGHHMFSCHTDYSSEDLKKIQCYVCKEFGHLCCVDFKYEGQTVVSCYNCGQSGHFGSVCVKLDRSTSCSRDKSYNNREVNDHMRSKNRESDKAGQCTGESTGDGRSFTDKEIKPNFVYAPLRSARSIPNKQT